MSRTCIDDPSFWGSQDEVPDTTPQAPLTIEAEPPGTTAHALEPHYTRAEVATMFRVCQQTVSNWVKAKKLRSVGPGRGLRFRPSDLENMIDLKSGKSKS